MIDELISLHNLLFAVHFRSSVHPLPSNSHKSHSQSKHVCWRTLYLLVWVDKVINYPDPFDIVRGSICPSSFITIWSLTFQRNVIKLSVHGWTTSPKTITINTEWTSCSRACLSFNTIRELPKNPLILGHALHRHQDWTIMKGLPSYSKWMVALCSVVGDKKCNGASAENNQARDMNDPGRFNVNYTGVRVSHSVQWIAPAGYSKKVVSEAKCIVVADTLFLFDSFNRWRKCFLLIATSATARSITVLVLWQTSLLHLPNKIILCGWQASTILTPPRLCLSQFPKM